MRNPPMRLACPTCLGVALERSAVADGVSVDHCGRCGGTWLPREQVPTLRAVPASAVRAMIRRADDAGFLCHDCHAPMERDAATCRGCGWPNRLECPRCAKPMRRETHDGVTVDVCRSCTALWLDHHELSALWATAAAAAVAATPMLGQGISDTLDAGGFLLDVLFYAPDLAVHTADAAIDVVGAGAELVGSLSVGGLDGVADAGGLFSGVVDALGAVGEAAGTVFGAIAGIFEGLG